MFLILFPPSCISDLIAFMLEFKKFKQAIILLENEKKKHYAQQSMWI